MPQIPFVGCTWLAGACTFAGALVCVLAGGEGASVLPPIKPAAIDATSRNRIDPISDHSAGPALTRLSVSDASAFNRSAISPADTGVVSPFTLAAEFLIACLISSCGAGLKVRMQ